MKEYIFKSEYNKMILEYQNFKKIYDILKINSLEVILDMNENDTVLYFCIASNENNKTQKYITFYNENEKNVIQVLIEHNDIFFTLFDNKLITELNATPPKNDGFKYRVFDFNFLEEPKFIKQILYNNIDFDNTDLIKEINQEIKYYKDKTIEDKDNTIDNDRVDILLKELENKLTNFR